MTRPKVVAWTSGILAASVITFVGWPCVQRSIRNLRADRWIRELQSSDPAARERALQAIEVSLCIRALPALLSDSWENSEFEDEMRRVARTIGESSSDAADALVQQIDSDDEDVRLNAAWVLSHVAGEHSSPRMIETLCRAIRRADPELAPAAASALMSVDDRSSRVIEFWREVAAIRFHPARGEAVSALANIVDYGRVLDVVPPREVFATAREIALDSEESYGNRASAVWSLPRFGCSPGEVADVLVEVLAARRDNGVFVLALVQLEILPNGAGCRAMAAAVRIRDDAATKYRAGSVAAFSLHASAEHFLERMRKKGCVPP